MAPGWSSESSHLCPQCHASTTYSDPPAPLLQDISIPVARPCNPGQSPLSRSLNSISSLKSPVAEGATVTGGLRVVRCLTCHGTGVVLCRSRAVAASVTSGQGLCSGFPAGRAECWAEPGTLHWAALRLYMVLQPQCSQAQGPGRCFLSLRGPSSPSGPSTWALNLFFPLLPPMHVLTLIMVKWASRQKQFFLLMRAS